MPAGCRLAIDFMTESIEAPALVVGALVFRRVEKISMLIGSYLENSRYFSCFLALCNVGPSSWVLASARCGRRARGGPPRSRLRRSAARRAPARPRPEAFSKEHAHMFHQRKKPRPFTVWGLPGSLSALTALLTLWVET